MCRRRRLSKTLLLSPLVSHLLFLLILLLLFPLQPTSTAAATSEEKDPRAIDREALLQFKAAVTSDPAGALSEWSNSPNSDPCSWPGVSCDSGSRVSALNISGCGESPSCSYSALSHPLRGGRLAARWDQTKRLVGRLPPALGKLSALRVLALPFHGFQGELPVEVSGSRSLLVLDLRGNSLSGPVPLKFGPFLRVVHLGLNNFSGAIPESLLSGSPDLETVNFSHNELNGTIPPSFGRLVKLKWLSLSSNYLSGRIPAALGNGGCWSLEHLDLSGNFLVSGIPDSLGNCSSLRSLLLFRNLLDDVIPASLGKLANLEALDVSMNSLSGPVPAELGNCKKLSVLILTNLYAPILADKRPAGSISVTDDFNYFQGGIHENITSLPGVRVLWAPRATLEGDFPRNWGSCKSLEMVNLGDNLFTGSLPLGLVKCNNLKYLNLSSNKLSGWLDDRLPVPCMEVFDVSRNQLSGQIPRFTYNGCLPYVPSSDDELSATYYSFFMDLFRKDISLTLFRSSMEVGLFHNFGDNNFTGNLPSPPAAIERIGMETIYALLVYGNNLDGPFMGNVFDKCNHVKGLILNISNNLISGAIPSDIDVLCRSLVVLDVSGNRITGTVLPLVSLANSLVALDLSRNRLRGHIPESFTQLKKLKYLSLAENNLTGGIPISLSRLQSLEELDLSSNSLTGGIPSELMNLRNLSALLLDENKLSGRIPSTVANMTSLSVFNVSFNNLSGPIPLNTIAGSCDSVIGNPHLASCPFLSLSVPPPNLQGRDGQSLQDNASPGSDPEKDKGGSFNSIEIASVTSASAIVSVLLALIVVYIYTRKCAPRSPVQGSGRKEVTVFKEIGVRLTYENVVRATGNFNASNCIGSGGFGATYKAEIVPGLLVAIKRLSVGRFQGLQQFQAEIKTLGRLRHENLVTLIGCHVSEAEMFLIYNYLPGGNLENFIHERSKRPVDWRLLHKIALDVARALAYLHDHCVPRILHRDVKPSNILLDNDYTAYLSDFGLARLLGNSETHATTGVAGTFGYVAPEYAMTCRVSDKADVYSYGVVLLELISDKKVLDPSFSQYGNGFNIVAWACMLLRQGRAKEFFMEGLWDVGPHDDLVETLHLAVMCTADSLTIRPTMKLVVQRLKQLQPPS